MVRTTLVALGAFLVLAGALGTYRADTVARLVVAADPFEGAHPGGDDPVAWASSLTRWIAGGVALLGVGLFGVGVLG